MPTETEIRATPDGQQQEEQQKAAMEAVTAALMRQKPGQQPKETPGPEGKGQDGPLSGAVKVDWGDGVVREVQIEDLVKAAKSKEDLQATERLLKQNADAQWVLTQLGKMSEEDRDLYVKALSDPAQLVPKPKPRDEDDDGLRALLGETSQTVPAGEDIRRELKELREGMTAMGGYLQGTIAEKAKEMMSERVDKLMATYKDAFPKSSALTDWAKDSIMTQIVLDPRADLEELVTRTAAKALHVHGKDRVTRITATTAEGPSELPPGLTGEQLMNGDSLERLKAFETALRR